MKNDLTSVSGDTGWNQVFASIVSVIRESALLREQLNTLEKYEKKLEEEIKRLKAYKTALEGQTMHACPCCGGTVVGVKDFAGGV